VGYVAVAPHYGRTSDSNAIQYTDSSFAGDDTAGIVLTAGSGVVNATTNAPFVLADFADGSTTATTKNLEGRLVAAALFVRAATAVTNTPGMLIMCQHPQHESLGGYNAAALMKLTNAAKWQLALQGTRGVSRYAPVHVLESGYWKGSNVNFEPGESSTGPSAQSAFLAAYVQGGVAGDIYEWEYYAHYEASGQNVQAMETPSWASSDTMEYVRNISRDLLMPVVQGPGQTLSFRGSS
jgi:hypothetical protein